ncbi:MAG: SagB/ThcOx family dehydrogenase [Fimbriimonadaceae bacterium]|nr:SagB/ThcOx family dehydrogenase [Alphaproteobacteria bacterium]
MNDITLAQAITRRRSGRDFAARPVPLAVLQALLWAAQGITGDSGKRTVPSASAQHPLRLYVSCATIEGCKPGVYAIEGEMQDLTLHVDRDVGAQLQDAALEEQPWIGNAAGIVTICANLAASTCHFAEQPPFGTRGSRYVYIEAGAAAQNIALQATASGLACVLVAGLRDDATAGILNLAPPLAPVLHMCFGWPSE